MKMRPFPHSAFTLLEIMLVVAIISMVAIIAIPNFVRARGRSQAKVCISNLRQIQEATAQWALENKQSSQTPVQFSDIRDYLRGSMVCPAGGTSFSDSYTITNAATPPVCQKVPSGPEAHVLPSDTAP
jgi:prepilin-type N-terminal cleavage/methylation domain-containing protein